MYARFGSVIHVNRDTLQCLCVWLHVVVSVKLECVTSESWNSFRRTPGDRGVAKDQCPMGSRALVGGADSGGG